MKKSAMARMCEPLCFCLLLLLLMPITFARIDHGNIRADDNTLQSLMTLVQQQAATIQTLQARLDGLDLQVHALNDMKQNVTSLTSQVSSLTASTEKKVAFSARMSPVGSVTVGDDSPFIFDAVVTNIGGGYNGHSGIFIAPYDGVYVFSFFMINTYQGATIHAGIVKDGTLLGMGTSDGGTNNDWDDGSVLVTTHLAKGDEVYVKRIEGGNKVYGWWYTNFSGFLIAADA